MNKKIRTLASSIAAIVMSISCLATTVSAVRTTRICSSDSLISDKFSYEKTTFENWNDDDCNVVTPHIKASDDEIYEVARVLQHECCGFGDEGRYLVATVIANRVNSEKYPDNVWDVVMEPGQFGNGKEKEPCSDCLAAAKSVFNDDVRALPCYVFNFQSIKKGYWKGFTDYCAITQGKYSEYFCYKAEDKNEAFDALKNK